MLVPAGCQWDGHPVDSVSHTGLLPVMGSRNILYGF